MPRTLLICLLCCLFTLLIVGQSPAAAADEPIWVSTFDHEFINWANTHTAVFEFPPADLYEQIICHMQISCPEAPGDCDPWDRFGNLRLRAFEQDSTFTDFEIARFITPYDITYGGGPDVCGWSIDVTDYQFMLHDQVMLLLYVESWIGGDRGWLLTIDFEMIPGTPEREAFAVQKLWQSGNLIYGDPDNPVEDFFVPLAVEVPEQATWARFRAFSTGHGFWNTDNAAEFSEKWQGVGVDGQFVDHILWRDDCAANPCKPQLGTWQYNRAGWCPGDKAEAWNVDVSEWVEPGQTSDFTFQLEPYENWCRPNNPECVDETGCECPGHAYYKFESQVVFYRVPTTSAVGQGGPVQARLHLVGNYPNPFNPSTTIKYNLAVPGAVTISVYDAAGALVSSRQCDHADAGTYSWSWTGRDRAGNSLPAGVYLYEVRHGDERVSAKMLLLK